MTQPASTERRYRCYLYCILMLALVLRTAVFIASEYRAAAFDFPDSHRFVRIARNLPWGRGAVDFVQRSPHLPGGAWVYSGTDPAYPHLLSIAIRLGAKNDMEIMRFARLMNILLALGSVIFLAWIAREYWGDRVALLAALLLAIDPLQVFFSGLVLTETLYTFLLLLTCFTLLFVRDLKYRVFWAICAGFCAAVMTLTKSTSLLFIVPMGLLVWYMTPVPRPRKLAIVLSLAISYCATLAPNIYRNYMLFHEFIPTRTGGGASLLEALGPWADGSPGMDRIKNPDVPVGSNEVERDRIYRHAALQWVRENPGQTARLAIKKFARTWSPLINASDYQNPKIQLISIASTVPVYLLALVGIWTLRTQRGLLVFLLLPAVYFSLIHMVFVGSIRYRMPAMPFVFVLAAVGFFHLVQAGTHTDRRHIECRH